MPKTKRKHSNGILRQISAAFLLPIFFVILVGLLSYKHSEQGLRKKYEEAAMTTLKMTTRYIDLGLRLVESEALKYAYDSNFNEYFMGLYENNTTKKSQAISTMQSGMKSARTTNPFIYDIYIITKSDVTMQTTKQMTAGSGKGFYEDFSKELENAYGGAVNSMWMDTHRMLDEHFNIAPDDYILSYYCTSTNSKAGVTVDVSTETIANTIRAMDMEDGSMVGFLTKDGREITSGNNPGFSLVGKDYYQDFLASEDLETITYITENQQEYLLLASKSDIAGAILYAAVPKDAVVAEAESIKSITVFLVLLSCLIVITAASLLSVRISRRMNVLSAGLSRASSGDLTVTMDLKGNDEFSDIGRSINLMLEHMHRLVQNTTRNVFRVSQTAQDTRATSVTVNSHSEEISNAIGEIHTGITSQQESAGECQRKMDTLSDEIKMMLKEIESIEQFSVSSNEMIKRGIAQMDALSENSCATASVTSKVIQDIGELMEKTKSIENFVEIIHGISAQTNLLSLNASIEAARAGEQGKGFATVAGEIKSLSEEIKNLVEMVDSSIEDVEHGTEQLSASINTSHQALEESLTKADETYAMFTQITQAAEESETVQSQISLVIDDSRNKLQTLSGFFEKMKSQYDTVMRHINRVSNMGTTKSAMYEDIDNMMAQIPPIIDDYNAG